MSSSYALSRSSSSTSAYSFFRLKKSNPISSSKSHVSSFVTLKRMHRSCSLSINNHHWQWSRFLVSSTHDDVDQQSDVEVEKDEIELEQNADEPDKAWKEMLDRVKAGGPQETWKKRLETLKTGLSQEAFELYSKKALFIVKDASEKLKLLAEKSSYDLTVLAQEIREESEGYLSSMAENSPESVRDMLDMYQSSAKDITEISKVRDFYVGVPFGILLFLGGFLSFMFSGSLSAIRFGVILGATLLALSISSLRACKKGESSTLALKGQTAITTVIFLREFRLLLQRHSFPNFLMTFISGAILAFYLFKIVVEDNPKKGPTLEQ